MPRKKIFKIDKGLNTVRKSLTLASFAFVAAGTCLSPTAHAEENNGGVDAIVSVKSKACVWPEKATSLKLKALVAEPPEYPGQMQRRGIEG
jgi:hypothetical protein